MAALEVWETVAWCWKVQKELVEGCKLIPKTWKDDLHEPLSNARMRCRSPFTKTINSDRELVLLVEAVTEVEVKGWNYLEREDLGLNNTLLLCKTRRGSLQDEATISDTYLNLPQNLKIIATRNIIMWMREAREIFLIGLNGGLWSAKKINWDFGGSWRSPQGVK